MSGLAQIMHVDMDAFYASVMTRGRPDLVQTPVIVGGGHRGVVLSANYIARRSGVRSAMPMTRARRLCPAALVIEPDYDAFAQVSSAVMEIFRRFTPWVQALSSDEAFLDVSGANSGLGGPKQIAEDIRAQVFDEQAITCSVGVAATVGVAKIASRRAKPDGVVMVPAGQTTAFLHPLSVQELWGVGEKTAEHLHRLGLLTVGDLANVPEQTLRRALGPAQGQHLHDLAWGIDARVVTVQHLEHEAEKSMGADRTFAHDTDDPDIVRREMLRLSSKVAARMRSAGVAGRTVTIRVRFSDFATITRARTMTEATDVTQEIYQTAVQTFNALKLQRARIRLIGVRVTGLVPRETVHRQLRIDEPERGWAEADRAVDQAGRRFGAHCVQRAAML